MVKRYRINPQSFCLDSRATQLGTKLESMSEQSKYLHKKRNRAIIESLINAYGSIDFQDKVERFKEFGNIDFSINWQYINFIIEIRRSYVMGCYYPALVSACTLGERILNYLYITLRDHYPISNKHPKLKTKNSCDNWDKLIEVLMEWNVLFKDVPEKFKKLYTYRCNSVHYNEFTELDTKNYAINAIRLIMDIVKIQFGFIPEYTFQAVDAMCIKKDMENNPYVKNIILKHTVLVGYKHYLDNSSRVIEPNDYEENLDIAITDEKFKEMRENFLNKQQPRNIFTNLYDVVLMHNNTDLPEDSNIGLFVTSDGEKEIYTRNQLNRIIEKIDLITTKRLLSSASEITDINHQIQILNMNLSQEYIFDRTLHSTLAL